MQPILSPRSARVVAARKLSRRRAREQACQLLVEGPQALREALLAGVLIDLFATSGAGAQWDGLLKAARVGGAGVHLVEPGTLASLSQTENPQGLVGVARWRQPDLRSVLTKPLKLALLLHEVSDPGNAGAMIRVADAVGADLVAFSENSVDPTNGKCVRASTGSVFHVPIVHAGPTLAAIEAFQATGVRVLAADVTIEARDIFQAAADGSLANPTLWVFGNEAHGLPDSVREGADEVLRIPILGRAESLNLATAGAVCMYTSVLEQRRGAPL